MYFDPFRLDDTSGEWRELRLGLCGRSGTTRTPFFNMDGFYANGNYELDPASLQGFVLGTMTPSDRRGETTSGSLLIDEIACIEDAGADPFLLGEPAAGAAGRWETCVKPRDHLADECAAPRARRFQGGLGRVNLLSYLVPP